MDEKELEKNFYMYMDFIFRIKYPTNLEDLKKTYLLNSRELYVEYKNGHKYIIDIFESLITNMDEDENEISEEYDRKYFCKRFNRILYYKNVTQLELSNMTRNKLQNYK